MWSINNIKIFELSIPEECNFCLLLPSKGEVLTHSQIPT